MARIQSHNGVELSWQQSGILEALPCGARVEEVASLGMREIGHLIGVGIDRCNDEKPSTFLKSRPFPGCQRRRHY